MSAEPLESGDCARAVARDIAKLPTELAQSGLAAAAMAMAREIDGHNSATSKSMCVRSLLDAQDRIRALTPATVEGDGLDDLATRRAARIAGGPAASGQ